MNTIPASFLVAAVLAGFAVPAAQAQVEPQMSVCERLAELETAWLNLDTQDVNATLADIRETARQMSDALDRVAGDARRFSPAAFDQLMQAHESFEAVLATTPDDATPQQIQDRIREARDNERVAVQNFASNIACPGTVFQP